MGLPISSCFEFCFVGFSGGEIFFLIGSPRDSGAGVKKAHSYGTSDRFGAKAEKNPTSVYDFNATILHLMGLDYERLSFYHNGLERRLTNVHGYVIDDILA
ncbi:DUF1501 domain-containing protein [Akkermansiaceae bacterium]|nr:DUF1501 domain-containing protein [Akkermansiaceae bacterium]